MAQPPPSRGQQTLLLATKPMWLGGQQPVFSAEQRRYLCEFNFEALLRKQPGCAIHWGTWTAADAAAAAAADEEWVVAQEFKIYRETGEPTRSSMRLYQGLVAVARQIAKQVAPCTLRYAQHTATFADNDGACRIALRVCCRLVLQHPENLVWEALRRDNLEMLNTWLCRPEVGTLVNVPGGPKGQTPLGHALGDMDMTVLMALLNHGALPLGIDPSRFVRYTSSYRAPVVRAWWAHVRSLALAFLAIGKQEGKRHLRHEMAMFARAMWELRWKYR